MCQRPRSRAEPQRCSVRRGKRVTVVPAAMLRSGAMPGLMGKLVTFVPVAVLGSEAMLRWRGKRVTFVPAAKLRLRRQ